MRKFCGVLAIVAGLLLSPSIANAAPVTAVQSDKAADIVGINTHLYYGGTPYVDRYNDIIKPRLLESGIRYIRDGNALNSLMDTRLRDLRASGIKTSLYNDNRFGLEISTRTKDRVKALNSDPNNQVVDMLEGQNEPDCGNVSHTDQKNAMVSIWNLFKNDPATAGIPIAGSSFCNTRSSPGNLAASVGTMGQYMNLGNLHSYSGATHPEGSQGGGWGFSMDAAMAEYRKLSPNDPQVVTEFGFHNDLNGGSHPGVSQRAAAKYLPRTFLTYLRKGIKRAYIYQLINTGEDFALLNDDGSPRLQFNSVKNFIKLFGDAGADFTPGSLGYTLSGNTANVDSMLLQKRDGRFYLVLWMAVNSFNTTTDTDVNPTPQTVKVTFDSPVKSAAVYKPMIDLIPRSTHTNPSSVDVLVYDHLQVVEVTK